MRNCKHSIRGVLAALTILCTSVSSRTVDAIEFMKLKDAIKHFIPAGSSPYKVTKTIPDGKYNALKKRFRLKDTDEFKNTLKKGPHTVFIAKDANKNPTMYIMILDQYWKTCSHKFAVGITPAGAVKEVLLVGTNCRFVYPINKKSFLKQFIGKKAPAAGSVGVALGKDIDAVSGATMSSEAATIVIRRALALHEIFFAS